MQLQIGRAKLRIDWLMLLFPILAALLGQGREIVFLLISLMLHEAAHLCAARMLHISLHSIRLTPFGGMSRIENPYSISALHLCIVSAAGPAANFLLILLCASLCYWRIIGFSTASGWIHVNALLMLFNLLPALPLDGGRILYALLSLILPRRHAANIGIFAGQTLAVGLILFALWGFICCGILNLSPLFAALFLIVSAEDERRALTDSQLHSLISCMRPLKEPTPLRIVAVDSAMSPETVLHTISPDRPALFAVFQDGRFTAFTDGSALLDRILQTTDNFPSKKSQ